MHSYGFISVQMTKCI